MRNRTVRQRMPDWEPAEATDLTYGSYLHLPELLSLQTPRSDNPDEVHFIVVHQAIELWFKVMLQDLRRTVRLVDDDQWSQASVVLRRLNQTGALVLEHTRSLRDLPPRSFHEFRTRLGHASGAQSTQFRELEIISGLRDDQYFATQRRFSGGRLPEVIVRALRERSLADAHQDSAARYGVWDWAAFYTEGLESPLYLLSEQLLDYDEIWLRWRAEHMALVERLSGSGIRGTGGTDPVSFLETTRRYRFFPYLWQMRGEIALRGGGERVR